MKLWQKASTVASEVEKFTVGKDKDFDMLLAPYDVLGNMAHATMLETIGLLTSEEKESLLVELKNIYTTIESGNFLLDESVEDIHSQIELLLTQKLGDTGKKIHAARSRNDQVLVDIKLYLRSEIHILVNEIVSFFNLLQSTSEALKQHLLPGYTHLQLAMPSSFGLWFGAYAEALVDDMISLKAAYDIVNKNPLGSAAGYGASFPIDRQLTTKLLGFETMHFNAVNAQMSRGKTERITAQALANIADTLAKMSMDMCLYLNQNFDFVSFPAELTTGSSIMPHKKNPDVFELIRSYCNRIKALPNEITLMTTNLPSGYHRDLQLLKEHLFPAFQTLKDCISMATLMFSNIQVKQNIMDAEMYKYAFSVEAVNAAVLAGTAFRDAYKEVGKAIEEGTFTHNTQLSHTHIGSIGNLANEAIKNEMEKIVSSFNFNTYQAAYKQLLA